MAKHLINRARGSFGEWLVWVVTGARMDERGLQTASPWAEVHRVLAGVFSG